MEQQVQEVSSTEFELKDIGKIIYFSRLVKHRISQLQHQLSRAHKLTDTQLSYILSELREFTTQLNELNEALTVECDT